MNISRFFLVMLMLTLSIAACKPDEPVTPTVDMIMSGTIDLNGAIAATGVSTSNDLVITFSTAIDTNTATQSSFALKRGTTSESLTVTATDKTVTLNPKKDLLGGTKYTLTIDGIRDTEGALVEAVTITFTTAGIGLGTAPQSGSQVLYLPLNGSIEDITGNATSSFERIAYTADRFGATDGAANFRGAATAGTGDIVELTGNQFVNSSTSISVWMKIDPADYATTKNKPMMGVAAQRGYFFEVGDGPTGPNWFKMATNHKVDPDPKSYGMGPAWSTANVEGLFDNNWHHVVMTFDALSYTKVMYLDGAKLQEWILQDATSGWNMKDIMLDNVTPGVDGKLCLGYFSSRAHTATDFANYSTASNTFKGAMDDIRIWSKALTSTEVANLYNSEKVN